MNDYIEQLVAKNTRGYTDYRVVEADNPLAVHCLTWNTERAVHWIKGGGHRFFPGREFIVQGKMPGSGKWVTL